MQYTLKRVKAIVSANYSSFITAAIATAIVLAIVFVVFANIESSIEKFKLTQAWVMAFVIALFVLPILDYVAFHASNLSNGLKGVQLDTKVTKRNLFLLAGTLWSSAGVFAICILADSVDYLALASAMLIVLCWHYINKLLLKYAFTLYKYSTQRHRRPASVLWGKRSQANTVFSKT